jgi:cell division protein FtsB
MFEKFYKPLLIFEIILVVYLGWLIIKEKRENLPFKKDYEQYQSLIQSLSEENKKLKEKLDYLSNPENLKKELKDKLNLSDPNEKMIILPENF